MGTHLRPWLLKFVRESLKEGLDWKLRGNESHSEWEDDHSNIRRKVTFKDTSDKFLQLVEVAHSTLDLGPKSWLTDMQFTSKESPVKCRISDSQIDMIAIIATSVQRDFPAQHNGRSIVQAVSGSMLTVSAIELVLTQYGKPEEQITLNIHGCVFQGINQKYGTIGRPRPLHSDKIVKGLHQCLFDFLDDDSVSQADFEGPMSQTSHPVPALNGDSILSMKQQLENESENDDSATMMQQSQLATQVETSKKRKRSAVTPQIVADNPQVDIKNISQPQAAPNNSLLSLLPSDRQPKRRNIDVNQQGSRDASAHSDDEVLVSAKENQRAQTPEEKPSTVNDDKQSALKDELGKTRHPIPAEGLQHPQSWHHKFDHHSKIFRVPKEQQEILKSHASWNPAPAGKIFPHGNLPNSILLEIQNASATDAEQTPSTKSRSESPDPSLAASQRSHSVLSDIADGSVDEEGSRFSWEETPTSVRKTQDLPPDSSFPEASPRSPTLRRSAAESDMETAVPRALVGRTNEDPRVNMIFHQAPISPRFEGDAVPADVQQIQREIHESSQTSEDPIRILATQTGLKALGDIKYAQLVTKDPRIKALEERREWFDNRRRETGPANFDENDNSSHHRSFEAESLRPRDTYMKELEIDEEKKIEQDEAEKEEAKKEEVEKGEAENEEFEKEEVEKEEVKKEEVKKEEVEKGEAKKGEVKQEDFEPNAKSSIPSSQPVHKLHSATGSPGMLSSSVSVTPIELIRSSSTVRSPATLKTIAERKRAVHKEFKEAYPDYTGDLSHFSSMCRRLREVQPHRAVWDDFVIRQLTEYATYVSSRIMAGREVLQYPDYHSKTVQSLKYTKGILTEEMLDSLFPAGGAERRWGPKSRNGLDSSSQPQNAAIECEPNLTSGPDNDQDRARVRLKNSSQVTTATFKTSDSEAGRLFLPNAGTYWTEKDGWKIERQSRGRGQRY